MSESWKNTELGEVCERVCVGYVGPTAKHYCDEGPLFLRTKNVTKNGFSLKDVLHITQEFHDTLKKSSLIGGEVLMSRVITDVVNCAIVPDDLGPANCANVVIVKPGEKVSSQFLQYYIQSPISQTYLLGKKVGSAQLVVNTKVVQSWPIKIPELPEQKQIVAILDRAFAAIDRAKANIEKNIENANELFQSKLNEIFSQKGDGWEELHLGDETLLKIVDGDRGVNYPKKSDFLEEGFCVFMNTGNVRLDGLDFSNVMFINKERDNLLRKGKLQREDVILTTRGTIGNVGWYNKDVEYDHIRINSGMLIFRVNRKRILPEYLFTLFRSSIIKKQIADKTSGAAQPQLPIKTIVTFKIPISSNLEDQKEMVNEIDQMEMQKKKLISSYSDKQNNLVELKKSILHQAFAGELTKKEVAV